MVEHLKDAFFLTLDDVQLWVVDGVDGALEQLERLVLLLQGSEVARAASSGLDDVLSRLEDATAYYLPLPPTLREYSPPVWSSSDPRPGLCRLQSRTSLFIS